MIEIRAFGRPCCVVRGEVRQLAPGSAQLLAALLAAPGRFATIAELRYLRWEEAPEDAEGALRTAAWRLRRALADTSLDVRSQADGYRIEGPDAATDVLAFEALADRALAAPPGDDRAALDALALWTGTPFDGVEGVPATVLRTRLDERRRELERRLEGDGAPAGRTGRARPRHDRRIGAGELVGRGDELAVLTDAWSEATRGGLRVVELHGVGGIGKTSLLTALRRVTRPVEPFVARCDPDDRSPYGPFSREVREALDGAPDLRFDDEDPDRVAELFDAVARRFERRADVAPLLVVVDDAQWLSDLAADLLVSILGRLADRPAMLALARRPVPALPFDPAAVAPVVRIALGGISEPSVRELVDLHPELAAEAAALTRTIHRVSGGVPLFVKELLRAPELLGDDGGAPAPVSIEMAVASHVDGLDPAAQELVEDASFLGSSFTVEEWEVVSGYDPRSIDDALDVAVVARVLTTDDGAVGFTHDIIRSVLRSRVAAGRALDLHRRIATADWEALDPAARRLSSADLARHALDAAGAIERSTAERRCLEAAHDAEADLADEAAHRWYEAAAEVAVTPSSEIRLGLGRTAAARGWIEVANRHFEGALVGATDPEVVVEAALRYGGSWVRPWAATGAQPGEDLLERALEALDPEDPRHLRARARLARWRAHDPDRAHLRREVAEISALAAGADLRTQAAVTKDAWLTLVAVDELDEQAAHAERLTELGRSLDDGHLVRLGSHGQWRGELVRGRATLEDPRADDLVTVPSRRRSRYNEWIRLGWRAGRLTAQGRLDDAMAIATESLSTGEESVGRRDAHAIYFGQLALNRWLIGDIGSMASVVDDLVTSAPRGFVAWENARALLLAEVEPGAPTELPALPPEGTLRDDAWLADHAVLAHAAALLGDHEALVAIHDRLTPLADRHVLVGHAAYLGSVALHLAFIELALGDVDLAAEKLAAARERELAVRAGAFADLAGGAVRGIHGAGPPPVASASVVARAEREARQILDRR